MSNVLAIEAAFKRAEKVLEVAQNMDKAFSPEYTAEHLKMAIAAGIADAYNQGCNYGYEAGKLSAKVG